MRHCDNGWRLHAAREFCTVRAVIGSFDKLRRRGWRDWLGALALLGVLARALVPVGFMPMQLQGKMQMVLCAPQGRDAIHQHNAPRGSSEGAPCLFAASAAALAPQPFYTPPAAGWLCVASVCSSYCSPTRAAPLRHAAARGPPANV